MNLHQLRLFCTVVEMGSLTRAARALFISQPALSIQMQRLERAFGAPLVRRTRGGVLLTDAGRVLYESARAMLEQLRGAERRLAQLREGRGGYLTVGVSHTGALYHVTGTLKRFRHRYPEADVTLHVDMPDVVISQLRAGIIDVLVAWEPVPHDGLTVQPLTTLALLLTAAPDHPLAAHSAVPRAALRGAKYLALQYGPGVPGTVDTALLRAGAIRRVTTYLPSVDALKRAVEAGLGVTMLAPFTVRSEVAAGTLVQRPIADFTLQHTLVVAFPAGRDQSPLVQAFVALFRETLAAAGVGDQPPPRRAPAQLPATARTRPRPTAGPGKSAPARDSGGPR